MHVGFLYSTPFPPKEGIGFYVYKLANRLDDRGHDVTLLTRGGLTRDVERENGLTVVKAPFVPLYPIHVDVHGVFVNRIVERMAEDLDVLHVHSPLTPRVSTTVPVVLTVHTTVVEDAKHKESLTLSVLLDKLVTRISSRRIIAGQVDHAERVTTVSDSVKHNLDEHYGVGDALVVGNGVDTNVFHPENRDSGDSFVFSVGRLNHGKGYPDVIEAMGRLASREETVPELVIAGDGPFRGSLEDQARTAGIRDRITFLGFRSQEELIPLYRDASVFVLPSRHEGLPTVLLEAMACGCPILATNVSGSSEVVTDGENGVLVPPGQPDRLADALSSLLQDPDRRAKFGRRARRTVEERFAWERIVDEFEMLYRQVAGSA